MWSYWLCDTLTGDKILEVEPSGASPWSRQLNTDGSGSHTFVFDGTIPIATWADATTPWARTLVQCWSDTPVYAGLITGRPRNKYGVTLNHADLRRLFLARYPFGVDSYWEVEPTLPGKLTITSKSLEAAVGIVLDAGLSGPTGNVYSLPVVLPSLTTSGTFSTVYDNFNLQKVYDILTELQSMDGGPDVEFAPEWNADKLRWVTRAGALTGNTFEFHPNADESPVTAWTIDEDANKQVTGVFGVGEGSGASMVIGGTPSAHSSTVPARDDVTTWRLVKTNDQAAALALERVNALKTPTVTPQLTVNALEVDPTTLVLGSTVKTYDMDPFFPDQWASYRLVGISGGVSNEVGLTLTGERS